jgi:type I restriction enzyme R subunit
LSNFSESVVEEATLAWLEGLGWFVVHGPEIAPGEADSERSDYRVVTLDGRLHAAIKALNPHLGADQILEVSRKVCNPEGSSLEMRNRAFHRMLVNGVTVEYKAEDGSIRGTQARIIDFDEPNHNDFLAANQFTILGEDERRPDVLLFINGLPIGVIELKNAADHTTDIWKAFNQLQTYKSRIPELFKFNEFLVISDGLEARIGSLTADRERFMPWRTIEGDEVVDDRYTQLQVVLQGVFDRQRCLDLIRYFVVYEDPGNGKLAKKMAGYHQFHAVGIAVEETVRASSPDGGPEAVRERRTGYAAGPMAEGRMGDRRVGVVWHTQGSGKSLTMAFYAGRVILHPAMKNPTLVVLTDRNDLDDQLFGTFAGCHELLRQTPVQARDRAHLRELLSVNAGGVVFTTIHKFFPEKGSREHDLLTNRSNVVVIADEAHRSQYDFVDGYARHMRDALPNASFIGFTGTPIERADANTRSVFGDHISIYDIERAVKDGATVPIYYESRLAKIQISEEAKPKLDSDFEEATEGEETDKKEKLKSKWAALEALVGAENRIGLIAADLVEHFESRLGVMDGKAMVVCMSRRICIELYDAIVALRPDWHSHDDAQGQIKIVMTGSASDDKDWQPHIRTKAKREELANRFKNPADPFKLVIVRDMWLTGFDAPCMHTMYIDKPMKGHGLMQAIARVNRVFRDKPGGLVVDYLGLADQLRQALAAYTENGGTGSATVDQDEAAAVLLEHYEVCCDLMHGFDWSAWHASAGERLTVVKLAMNHVLGLVGPDGKLDGKQRFCDAVANLSRAFALAVPHETAIQVRDDVGFFQAVKAALTKNVGEGKKTKDEIEHAIRQIVSGAIASEGVIDVFEAAGLKKPDISILSDEFLAEVKGMPQRNLAVEMLRKLLEGEVKTRSKSNAVQARVFSKLLEEAVRKYQNRAIETAQIIEEMIQLAKDIKKADERGEELGLTFDEVAFYDALEVNDSAVKVLGDESLRLIAQELVKAVKANVTIDWSLRENVRANLRVIIKRILRKYGYPPDMQLKATETVLEQAELLADNWTAAAR